MPFILHLRRNLQIQEGLHYYKGKKECDFVITDHEEVNQLIQVTYTLHDEDTRQREIDGLLELLILQAAVNYLF